MFYSSAVAKGLWHLILTLVCLLNISLQIYSLFPVRMNSTLVDRFITRSCSCGDLCSFRYESIIKVREERGVRVHLKCDQSGYNLWCLLLVFLDGKLLSSMRNIKGSRSAFHRLSHPMMQCNTLISIFLKEASSVLNLQTHLTSATHPHQYSTQHTPRDNVY